jgi:hypothetical protein
VAVAMLQASWIEHSECRRVGLDLEFSTVAHRPLSCNGRP